MNRNKKIVVVEFPLNIPRLDISDNSLSVGEIKEKLDNFLFMRTYRADICLPKSGDVISIIFDFLKILKWKVVPQAMTWSDGENKSIFAKTGVVRIAPIE